MKTNSTGAGAGAGAGAAPAAASRAAAAAGSTASRPSAAPPTGRAACSWSTGGMAPAAGAAVADTLATAGPLIDASIGCRAVVVPDVMADVTDERIQAVPTQECMKLGQPCSVRDVAR